ncbi:DUF4013 domain-containing protein [Acidobacteriota bacterium]
MNYMRAVNFIFEHPRWWLLALIGGLSFFVPIVGPLVFMGFLVEEIERYHRTKSDTLQEFSFDRLGPYLMRGLWPFLAGLVLAVILIPVILVPALIFLVIPGALDLESAMPFFVIAFVIICVAICLIAALAAVPITLGAALGQNLRAALSWRFIKDFVSKMWLEILVTMLFLVVLAIVAEIIGLLACGIGIYCTLALVTVSQWHLYWQLYELYLERGGEPVPLADAPV